MSIGTVVHDPLNENPIEKLEFYRFKQMQTKSSKIWILSYTLVNWLDIKDFKDIEALIVKVYSDFGAEKWCLNVWKIIKIEFTSCMFL